MTESPKLSFTKVLVDDLDAETDFYQTVLGLKATQRFKVNIDGSDMEEVILESEGGHLILVHWLDQPAAPRGEVVVGFRATAVEEVFAWAQAAGEKVVRRPRAVREAGGLLAGLFEDPKVCV